MHGAKGKLWCILSIILVTLNVIYGARSTDELDDGFVVTEDYRHDSAYSYGLTFPPVKTAENAVASTSVATSTPRVTINSENDELVYWGCYEYWSDKMHHDDNLFNYSYHEAPSPFECRDACKTRYNTVYELFLLWGHYCLCTHWPTLAKKRILDEYCNFECAEPTGGDLKCGGNLASSIYCEKSDKKCIEGHEEESVDIIEEFPLPAVDKYTDDQGNLSSSYIGCAACDYTSSLGVCRQASALDPTSDYFPLLDPASCIQSCKRNFTSYGSDKTFLVSAVGWMFDLRLNPIPVCICHETNVASEVPYEFKEVCDTQCPGNGEQFCGNKTDTSIFSFYCVHGMDEGENCTRIIQESGPQVPDPDDPGEGGDDGGEEGGENGGEHENVTMPVIPTTPETPPSTPTEDVNTTTTTPATTTDDTTTTETSTPTAASTNTDDPTSNGTPPTAYTTRGSTIMPITTTPKPQFCHVKCDDVDHYGRPWTACAGKFAVEPCPNGATGRVRWYCSNNGTFASDMPDYSNCTSPWFDELMENLNGTFFENGTLPVPKSKEFLEEFEKKLKPSEPNPIPYYGHEITKIYELMYRVVNATRGTPAEQWEVIQRAMAVPGLLLTNQLAWRDIQNETIRGETGYGLLKHVERSIFTLINIVKGDRLILPEFYTDYLHLNQFIATFGLGSKNASLQDKLIFPIGANREDSFIKLQKGWESTVQTPAFVGVAIDSDQIEQIMPTALNTIMKRVGQPAGANKIINGKLLSLTLEDAGVQHLIRQAVEEKKLMVEVTFQHEIEAYGSASENVHRILHPGERPRAAQGSAACVFWSESEKKWSTNGCSIKESTPHCTVCQCNHLTSFALLMDVHNYVGKDFALEILTFLLCPLSAAALLITVIIFSSVGAIQSQRTTITKHLCGCLLIGIILILFVADRNYFNLPEGMCISVGIITHYVYLTAFVWMGIEGIHLYRMVVSVFDSGRSPTTIYRITAYGIPVLIVGITCVVGYLQGDQPYGNDLYCWLDGVYHWSFIGPVAVIMMGNMIVLCLALKTAHQMSPTTAHVTVRRRSYKTWIRGSFSLTVLLGITWLPGFFVLTSSPTIATASAYIFVVLNASQGIFLFVFHCLLNEKVRAAAERRMSLPTWLASSNQSSTKESTGQHISGKQRSENMKNTFGDGVMPENRSGGSGGTKADKDSWSFFRASDTTSHGIPTGRKARVSLYKNEGQEQHGRGVGGRGLKQRMDSNSSAGSQKALVDGARW